MATLSKRLFRRLIQLNTTTSTIQNVVCLFFYSEVKANSFGFHLSPPLQHLTTTLNFND